MPERTVPHRLQSSSRQRSNGAFPSAQPNMDAPSKSQRKNPAPLHWQPDRLASRMPHCSKVTCRSLASARVSPTALQSSNRQRSRLHPVKSRLDKSQPRNTASTNPRRGIEQPENRQFSNTHSRNSMVPFQSSGAVCVNAPPENRQPRTSSSSRSARRTASSMSASRLSSAGSTGPCIRMCLPSLRLR